MKCKSLASKLVYIFPCPSSFSLLFLSATAAERACLHSALSSHPARFPLLPRTAHMPCPAESPFSFLRLPKQRGPCAALLCPALPLALPRLSQQLSQHLPSAAFVSPSSSSGTGAQRTTPNKGTSTDFDGITACSNRPFSRKPAET